MHGHFMLCMLNHKRALKKTRVAKLVSERTVPDTSFVLIFPPYPPQCCYLRIIKGRWENRYFSKIGSKKTKKSEKNEKMTQSHLKRCD